MNLSGFSKKAFFASAMIFAIFAFSSCQDVIYSNIRKEVTLEDSSVEGIVRSIIRVSSEGEEYLYITNGGKIFCKKNSGKTSEHSYGGWETVCSNKDISSSDKLTIIALAADSDNVYAFAAIWDENTNKGQNRWNERAIYARADGGKSWEKVPFEIKTDEDKTGDDNPSLFFFCTNTIANENRQAFFNYDGNVYKLNGLDADKIYDKESDKNSDEKKDIKDAASCAYVNGEVKFASASDTYYGSASCTNETKDSPATIRYWSNKRTLYWGVEADDSKKVSAGDYIYSLAVTKDYILVGTASGIERYSLKNDGSVGDKKAFDTNAEAIMSGGYEVNSLLVIEPGKIDGHEKREKKEREEKETAIYAATDFEGRYEQFDHACIWAYYPARGDWNRD